MKLRTILLFGAPGSGKGTQGKILGTIPGYYHCACGDVFRNLNADSRLGRTFLDYSSRGELVPDEATVDLWRNNIQANTMLGRFNPERDTVVPVSADSGMALWREKLFAAMARNAGNAADYFNIPANRVIELGTRVEI